MTKRSPVSQPLQIDAATLRRLSVEASCDPRTILAVAAGDPVRGLARERAHAALVAAGLLPANGASK